MALCRIKAVAADLPVGRNLCGVGRRLGNTELAAELNADRCQKTDPAEIDDDAAMGPRNGIELKIDYSSTCDIKPSFQNHLDHARSDRLHLHLHFRLPLPAC
jgi:hypothetical protein